MSNYFRSWDSDTSEKQAFLEAGRLVVFGLRDAFVGLGLLLWTLGRLAYRLLKAVGWGIWRGLQGFLQGMKDILNASNPKDE
ncbi:MAG: hypothetical protein IJ722_07520 [Alloprevotella sp.]|nr:hypothetical protein [Alloprevotella sp.]